MQRAFLLAIYVWATHGANLPITRQVYGQVQVPEYQRQVPDGHVQQMMDKPIAILHQESEVNPDGSYTNAWQSENGISVQEEGSIKAFAKDSVAQVVVGRVAYTDNDGNPFVLTYTADETGFHPEGDHLPTPPPVPQAIARALEYIAAHPYVEMKSDDQVHYTPVVEVN